MDPTATALPAFLTPLTDVPRRPRFAPAYRSEPTWPDRTDIVTGSAFSAARHGDLAAAEFDGLSPAEGGFAATRPASEAGGAAPAQKLVAGVSMIGQEQTNWCWAAVTQAVRGWASAATRAQADLASDHIAASHRPFTCAPPRSGRSQGGVCAPASGCQGDCNDQHILSVVLGENGRLIAANHAPPAFADIVALVKQDKPVPCRVQWQPSGGHFILVIGWTIDADGTKKVHVLDPASVPGGRPVSAKIWAFDDFVNHYSTSGPQGSINYSYEVQ